MKNVLMVSAVLAALMPAAIAAPAYVDGQPMARKINSAVRDCPPMTKWTVPIIAWGADDVTLQANGGLKTAAGSSLGKRGLDITLKRQDVLANQIKAYLSCEQPFLRSTLGMAIQASDITEADPRTKMVAIYQHSWSAGGDVLVSRADIKQPSDLKGKTIVVQAYGPHVDYLLRILADAGLSPGDVKIRFVNDLTGPGLPTPFEALRTDGTVDAVMVISPDAAILTSDGTVGTGADRSVKGAHALMSTKSANRIITDLYFVRRDFFDANRNKLSAFVDGLLEAEDATRAMARSNGQDWTALMKLSAKIMLDDEKNVADAAGMWSDAETTGRQGNLRFFTDQNNPRGFGAVYRDAETLLAKAGYIATSYPLAAADWDWKVLAGLTSTEPETAKFDPAVTGRIVGTMHAQGTIDGNTLFSLDIHFQPNQKDFSSVTYAADFDRVVSLASTYGGAVITVEGHADPLGYLQALKTMETSGAVDRLVLNRMVQSGRNLSVQRAQSVRDAVTAQARSKGISLDPSQFDVVGLGYDDPATGRCNDRPCEPKTKEQWLSNMLVKFRVVRVEAEASAFVPVR